MRSNDQKMMKKFKRTKFAQFNEIFERLQEDLLEKNNISNIYTEEENELGESRKSEAHQQTMLVLFLHLIREGNEGGVRLRNMETLYSLSKGTVSNYIRHVALRLYKNLRKQEIAAIKGPKMEDMKAQEGLLYALRKAQVHF